MAIDSDEEYESFQVTEQDLLNELHPKKRKFTKEDRIYGMWAEHDSDDDDDRKGGYTRPVMFVSSGVQGGEKVEDDDSEEEDLDAEAQRILQGLEEKEVEKGGEKIGVGKFRTAALEKNKTLGSFTTAQAVAEKKTTPTTAAAPPTSTRKANMAMDFGQSTGRVDREWGKWEKHTSGFGSRMLNKMGYVPGKGLGSGGGGIVNPVKAKKHTEFGDGSVKVAKPADAGPSAASLFIPEDQEDEEEQKKFDEQLQQWRTTDSSKKARPKYVYKTIEELKQSGKKQFGSQAPKSHTSVKVIDMTGPQKRVLSSYEEIHDRHSRPDSVSQPEGSSVFLPELLHNITLLVEKTESEILQSDRSLQYNRDLIVNLSHERVTLEQDVSVEQLQIEKLSEILKTVEICEDRLAAGPPLTLTECEKLLSSIQTKYPAEYRSHELSAIAVAVTFPLIRNLLKGWDMLTTPYFAVDVFQTWREVLKESESSNIIPSPNSMDPYDRLVWEIWMPIFRRTVSIWSPRQCNPLINLLECWMPLLPAWILDNILDQLITPRLQHEVDVWDPTSDTVPIHAWVHPWLPVMEQRLEILYAPIRYKLAIALNNWHPSDSSAHKILEPWVHVFTLEAMEVFLVRTILPKLAYCLDTLVINPHQQQIASFEWVMAWRDMISIHHYANLLDKHFFPKWLQVLQNWLSSNTSCNFNEVTKWYTGWKGMLDAELLNEPMVKRYFGRALDLMNHAVSGTLQPGMRENVAYFTSTERRKTSEVATRTSLQNALTAPMSVSFKDVVERLAEDNGLLFMPIPGQKQYEGKALYSFGRITVYIDRGVVFAKNVNNIWLPVSLDKLLELAR